MSWRTARQFVKFTTLKEQLDEKGNIMKRNFKVKVSGADGAWAFMQGIHTFRTKREALAFIASWCKCEGNRSTDDSAVLLPAFVPEVTDQGRADAFPGLIAERDRLRAALEQLAALNDSALAIEYVRGIARAALNQDKE